MRNRKKRCLYCAGRYVPRPNVGSRQKACGAFFCLKARKRSADRKWHRKNRLLHLQMIRDWFQAHPGYLKAYRLNHPEYCRKNRLKAFWRWRQRLFDKKTSNLVTLCLIKGKQAYGPTDNKTRWPHGGDP